MKKIKTEPVIIVMFLFILCSCSTWSNKEWENLQDRDFHFQKFSYFEKGVNNKKVFEEMKNFPVDKILKIITHKYGIKVDTTEYEDFLRYEDTSKIEQASIFSPFIWGNSSKNTNTIELEFRKELTEKLDYTKLRYYLYLKTGGKTRAEFLAQLNEKTPYLVTIAKSMDYSRVNPNSDDSYVNNGNKSVVDLTTGIFKNKPADAKTDIAIKPGKDYPEKMKSEIREYIKNLSPADRRRFRDDTIKYLYKVIE